MCNRLQITTENVSYMEMRATVNERGLSSTDGNEGL